MFEEEPEKAGGEESKTTPIQDMLAGMQDSQGWPALESLKDEQEKHEKGTDELSEEKDEEMKDKDDEKQSGKEKSDDRQQWKEKADWKQKDVSWSESSKGKTKGSGNFTKDRGSWSGRNEGNEGRWHKQQQWNDNWNKGSWSKGGKGAGKGRKGVQGGGKGKGKKGESAQPVKATRVPPKRKIMCNQAKRGQECTNKNCEYGHRPTNFDVNFRFWDDPLYDKTKPFQPKPKEKGQQHQRKSDRYP